MNDLHKSRLSADRLTLAYDQRQVSTDLSVAIPNGSFTVIIGPNACGKSTLLRSLARLIKPRAGQVLLDEAPLAEQDRKQVARIIGLLPQNPIAPDGITVADLVGRGRFPHQSFLRQWSQKDADAIEKAMIATGVDTLADRSLNELSGGQRQRVWVAMVLAQETPILLLDEPTTFLDIVHQIDLLDLFTDLNADGKTLVTVLHDLNQACRYASYLIAMKDGAIVAQGRPDEIVTEQLLQDVFGLAAVVMPDPIYSTPMIVPKSRR